MSQGIKKNNGLIKKILMISLCVFSALFIFTACGGSSLVGRWVAVEEGGQPLSADERLELNLSRNGTGTLTEEWRGEVWVDDLTWSSNNGIFTFTTEDWGSESGPYRISGRRLYLYDDAGRAHTVFERR